MLIFQVGSILMHALLIMFTCRSKLNLNSFVDHSVQAIYLCHTEHFRSVISLSSQTFRQSCVLVAFYLSVPDLLKFAIYHSTKDISAINSPLRGGQDYEFNYHKSIYDLAYLSSLLVSVGFNNVHLWDPKITFGATHKDYSLDPISLNVSAYSSF